MTQVTGKGTRGRRRRIGGRGEVEGEKEHRNNS